MRRRGVSIAEARSDAAAARRGAAGAARAADARSWPRWRCARARVAITDADVRLADACVAAAGGARMTDRMRRIHRIHFVGIGGSGMGGIAEVLLNLGYQVQGSDLKPNAVTQRLARLGAQDHDRPRADNVGEADVLVVSTAVQRGQPGSRRGARAPPADRAARRDARRADALSLRDRGRRHARQDDDDQHGRERCSPKAASIRPSSSAAG